jgi:hypothetical protein
MENEKDLSDSEIESDLEEDIVFGKLFDFGYFSLSSPPQRKFCIF